MNTIQPEDFATDQQIARNHIRVSALTCPPLVDDLFAAELAAEALARDTAMRERWAKEDAERERLAAIHAKGEDLPLFAA